MTFNIYKDRIIIQVKVTTQTAIGEDVIWKPVETRYAIVIPLSVEARAVYQQLQSQVGYKIIFRGSVSLSLGDNRMLWKDKILEMVEPAQEIDDTTIVVMREA